jgi:hypothetical protein
LTSARRTLFFSTPNPLSRPPPPEFISTISTSSESLVASHSSKSFSRLHRHAQIESNQSGHSNPFTSPKWLTPNSQVERPVQRRQRITTALLDNPFYDTCPLDPTSRQLLSVPRPRSRSIPKLPYKVLDAPELAVCPFELYFLPGQSILKFFPFLICVSKTVYS